jgi:hypothetical protein
VLLKAHRHHGVINALNLLGKKRQRRYTRAPIMESTPQRDAPAASRPVCLQCGQSLNLHNTRIDVSDGKAERVDVWFCIKHGFYRASESQPLKAGM